MSNQKSGGCKKKRRVTRGAHGEIRHAKIRATRQARHKKYGHSYKTRRQTKVTSWFVPKDERKVNTFEDEYQLYKKTKGRQGWNPNPNQREYENPAVKASKSVLGTAKYHLQDLMQRPIQYSSPEASAWREAR